jgi:hypothetical protein
MIVRISFPAAAAAVSFFCTEIVIEAPLLSAAEGVCHAG